LKDVLTLERPRRLRQYCLTNFDWSR